MHKDHSYIVALRNGDSSAISQLYEQYEPKIIRLIRRNSGLTSDGTEIFQRTVIALYERSLNDKKFELHVSIYTLIYAIAKNLWLKELRSSRRDVRWEDAENIPGDINQIDVEEFVHLEKKARRHILFWKMFEKLGSDCQKIIERYFDGQPMKDIAEFFKVTVGGVRVKKARCIKKLRNWITSDPSYNELTSNS